MPVSAVESHPQRQKIIDGILSGMSVRKVAASISPALDFNVIQRYKHSVVKPVLLRKLSENKSVNAVSRDATQMAIRAEVVQSPVRDRVEKLWSRIERGLDKAEDLPGGAISPFLAPLLSQAHKNVELQGTLSGELQQAGSTNIQVQLVVSTAANQAADFDGTTIDIKSK